MGRCFVLPNTRNFPRELEWQKVFYQNNQVGDILASFDLVPEGLCGQEVYEEEDENEQIVRRIPSVILPRTKKYSLEILFWGLRNMRNVKRLPLINGRFCIVVEIGHMIYNSAFIESRTFCENFVTNILRHEIVGLTF